MFIEEIIWPISKETNSSFFSNFSFVLLVLIRKFVELKHSFILFLVFLFSLFPMNLPPPISPRLVVVVFLFLSLSLSPSLSLQKPLSSYLPSNPHHISLSPSRPSLPLPLSHNKNEQFQQLSSILEYYYGGEERDEEGDRPSVGCRVKKLSFWFDAFSSSSFSPSSSSSSSSSFSSSLPSSSSSPSPSSSYCGLKIFLILSQQHSGTELLMSYLNKAPHSVGIHELFCCDNNNYCSNKSLGLSTYINMMCAIRMKEVGVKNVFIGLQYAHYWEKENIVDFIRNFHPGIGVIILKRDNYLSYYCAAAGHHIRKSAFIPRWEIEDLYTKIKRHQHKFRKIYCSLKEEKMKVLMITYEKLITNFNKTMGMVSDFIGENEDRKWYGGFVSKHTPLEGRVENFEEVKRFLEKNFPSYVCLLSEDCDFHSEYSCVFFSSSSSSLTSTEFIASRRKRKSKIENQTKESYFNKIKNGVHNYLSPFSNYYYYSYYYNNYYYSYYYNYYYYYYYFFHFLPQCRAGN